MNGRNTLIALVIFGLLLGAVLVFDPRQGPGSGASSTPQPTAVPPLSSLPLDAINQLTVQAKDGRRVVAQKTESGAWNLVEPETGEADRTRVNSLVSQIALRAPERLIASDPSSLAEYGLDTPEYVVELSGPSGSETYHFGATNPNQSGIYAQKQGQSSVWLMGGIATALRDMVERPPKAVPSPAPTGASPAAPAPASPPAKP